MLCAIHTLSNRLRVGLLSGNPPAANPYIRLLQQGLAAAGVQVELLTDPGPDGLPDAAWQADLLHLHWLELWGRPGYLSLAELSRLGKPGRGLRRLLVPLLNSSPAFSWRRSRFLNRFLDRLTAYRQAGGRLVYTVHNLAQHEGEAAAVEKAGLRRLLALADAVHVHSQFMADELQAWSGRDQGEGLNLTGLRLAVIPHGHYIDAYPNQVGRNEARRRLEVPADSFAYLFLGLVRPYKGVEELLPAFRCLENPHALLLVAGQSRPPDYAERLAALAAADPRIRWHPRFVPDDEVQLWMNAADVVVLPYRRVSTSGAALLAFSFGKPIVAPTLPAFAELLADNPALGLLYDPTVPDGLLDALRQAQSIDWLAHQPAILSWVRQFDWQEIGRQFAALYQEVLEGTGNERTLRLSCLCP